MCDVGGRIHNGRPKWKLNDQLAFPQYQMPTIFYVKISYGCDGKQAKRKVCEINMWEAHGMRAKDICHHHKITVVWLLECGIVFEEFAKLALIVAV